MLVLSRKIGEKIYVGKDIAITLVDIDRNKIRLGFEAPPDVIILRAASPARDMTFRERSVKRL